MAKVTAVTPREEDENRMLVTLSMKTSDLIHDLNLKQFRFYTRTFLDEWYLSKKAQQAAFIGNVTATEQEADKLEAEKLKKRLWRRGSKETKEERIHRLAVEGLRNEERVTQKAGWKSLEVGKIISCRVSMLNYSENCVYVEMVPPINGVVAKFMVKDRRHFQTFERWNQARVSGKRRFDCTVLRVEWNRDLQRDSNPIDSNPDSNADSERDSESDSGRDWQVEVLLFDPLAVEETVGKAPTMLYSQPIAGGKALKKLGPPEVVLVHHEYLLVAFRKDVKGVLQLQLGIVPMRLPYLFIPTTKVFKVGDRCQLYTTDVDTRSAYGGLVPCIVKAQYLRRKIKEFNRMGQRQHFKMKEMERKQESLQRQMVAGERQSNGEPLKKKRRVVREDTSASEMEELPELETEDEARLSDAQRWASDTQQPTKSDQELDHFMDDDS